VVSLDFSVTYSFRLYHGPGIDSAPSENEYQEHFLGVKAAGAWGWRPHHLHVPNVMEIWEPKPPGILWVTPGLLQDCFTFLPFLYQHEIRCDRTTVNSFVPKNNFSWHTVWCWESRMSPKFANTFDKQTQL